MKSENLEGFDSQNPVVTFAWKAFAKVAELTFVFFNFNFNF